MNRRLLAIVGVLAAVALPACSGGGGGNSFVLTVDGTAEVSTEDGVKTYEDGRHRVHRGDTVEVTDGSAVLALPGDASLELRAGRPIRAAQAEPTPSRAAANDSRVRIGVVPELVAGDALVLGNGDDVRVRAGGATFVLDGGAARVRRSTSVTLAVYEGTADVTALGRSISNGVPAYRQVAVADTGALPRRPVPLVYDRVRPDPWDVRFLGDAIDLGSQLERRALALNRGVTSTPNASLLSTLLPSLRTVDGFQGSLVDGTRSVGESAVGASIALSGPGNFLRRWNAAFQFREDGADWGLVALDQRARRAALFGALDAALDLVPGRFVAPSGTTTTTTTTSTPPGGSGGTTTTTSPGPTTPPTTVPRPPDPLGDLLDPVFGESEPSPSNPLGDLIDDVGGLLGSASFGVQPLGVLGS